MATQNAKAGSTHTTLVKRERKVYTIRADLHEKLKFVATASNMKLMDLIDRIAEREITSWESKHKVTINSLFEAGASRIR